MNFRYCYGWLRAPEEIATHPQRLDIAKLCCRCRNHDAKRARLLHPHSERLARNLEKPSKKIYRVSAFIDFHFAERMNGMAFMNYLWASLDSLISNSFESNRNEVSTCSGFKIDFGRSMMK